MPLLTHTSGKILTASPGGITDAAFVAPTITPTYAPANGQTLAEGSEISVTFNTTGIPDNSEITFSIAGVVGALVTSIGQASQGRSNDPDAVFWTTVLASGFQRGDVNESGDLDIEDVIGVLGVSNGSNTSGTTYNNVIAAIAEKSSTATVTNDIDANDYSTTATSPLTIISNTTSASFIIDEDLTTEGPETFQITWSYSYEHPVDGTTTITGTPNWTIADSSTTPVGETFVLGTNKASVDEGSSVTITLTTANVSAATTVGYTISGVTSADINSASLTGDFVTGTTDSVDIIIAEDATTESTENLVFTLDNGEDAITIPINDTSLNPTYSITASSSSVNEGNNFSVNLVTTDVPNGTEVGYTVSGVSTADINNASLTGNFVVQSNTASLSVVVTADSTLSEGAETFQIVLNNGAGGTVTVTINDTSVDTTPAYTNFTLQTATTVDEASTSTFRITGRNIATGTTLVATIVGVSGTVSDSDFTPATLTRTIVWNSALNNISQVQDFSVQLAADEITEGPESYKVVLAATDSVGTSTGSLESPTVTIGDTSLTAVTGQHDFSSSGTWTVPAGVTKISILCIAGGGGGSGIQQSGGYSGGAGAGGTLGYANNISVTPGEVLTATVGAGGTAGVRNSSGGGAGGLSKLVNSGATTLCSANGGGGAASGGAGGLASSTYTGTSGYAGGSGGAGLRFSRGGGGGGAGGYSGTGGTGQSGSSTSGGAAGSGGGGGGGGSTTQSPGISGGGGVGKLGQGVAGAGGLYNNDGGGGSGGEEGQNGIGGDFGGGGSGSNYTSNPSSGAAQAGGPGYVRVLYPGTSRQYPSTRTANEAQVTGTYDTLTASSVSIDESEYVVNENRVIFTLSTTDVPEGTTVGYTITSVSGTVNDSDFLSRDSLFTIGAAGSATVTMRADGDFATEGTESFKITLAATDSVGNDTENLQSPTVSISDDYVATVYNSISLDKSTYNEGETITITVNKTGNNSISTQVSYTISASGTGDFNQTSGVLTLLDGYTYEGSPYSASKTIITSDLTTESTETLTVTLGATDSNGNATGGLSTTATIVDSSTTPRIPGTGLVRTISMPSNAQGWYGLGYLFGAAIGGDNDFIITGGSGNGTSAVSGTPVNPNTGQVAIFNRATGATVRIMNSPTTSETYGALSKFGYAVDITEYNGYKYACILAPNYRDTSNVAKPRLYIYSTTDGFANITLSRTVELTEYTSYAGEPQTLGRGRTAFKAMGQYIVIGDYNYSTTGLCKYIDLADIYSNSTAATIDDWTGWAVGTNGTYIGYTDPNFDGQYGGISTAQEGRFSVITPSTGAIRVSRSASTYSGGYTNNKADNWYLGAGVALTANRAWFTSSGDDYSGYTDAGRLRNILFTGGPGATIINPTVTSTANDGLNYNSFKGLDANGDNYAVMVWSDPYGIAGQSVRVYNESGTVQNTLAPPSGFIWEEYGNVVITSEHLYLVRSPSGGGSAVIDVY
jgi:hypothetical protein